MLGGFRLLVDETPVELTPVTERLVALLALVGRTSRSRVAGTLWSDMAEGRALACLRTGIWRVNRTAGELVIASRSTLELTSRVEIDVRRYVSTAESRMRSASPTPASDVRGVIGYEGDLLPDWDDEWLLAERERLRQLRLHLLEEEADRLAGAERFGLALEAAFAALSADPLRESAHRTIIGIHLAEGNMSEARRAYQKCRQLLVNDLGVEPSDVTRRMLRQVPRRRPRDPARGVPARRAGAGWGQ